MPEPTNWFSSFFVYIQKRPSVRNTGLMVLMLLYFGQRDYTQTKTAGEVIKAYKELHEADVKEKRELRIKYDARVDKDIQKAEAESNRKDTIILIMNKALQKK